MTTLRVKEDICPDSGENLISLFGVDSTRFVKPVQPVLRGMAMDRPWQRSQSGTVGGGKPNKIDR
jgi:hypothetical protein